ncbi:MAG: hypothetical protein M3217_02325, partial [Actinomycetota bacterium]|nr:hypothetical protein [Actinomycetota bacterium]
TVRGVRPWLFRIAHNTSIDTVRGRRPQVGLDDLAETESSTLTAPSAASEAEDRAEFVQAVGDIRDLPDRQAGALVMRELSGLSYPDIAAAFATSTGNARQLVHGARSALHARRRGRDMDCEVVRLALSEAEGKTPRDRRVRAHLASCADCRAFQKSIRTRRSALAAVAPPLAPWAAADILARLLSEGPTSGAGLAAGGGTAAGGLGKIVGASGATKLAGGAAALGTAIVAGSFVAAGAGVLGGGGSEAPRFLTANVPELRSLRTPEPAPERAARTTPAREPASAPTSVPATTSAVDQAALVQRSPVSPVVDPAVSDGGVESGGAARDDARLELGTVRRLGLPALAGSLEKVVDDLLGRLDLGRRGVHVSSTRTVAVELEISAASIEKVLRDLLGRPHLRRDRAVSVKPRRRTDHDATVNRKPVTVNRKSRGDTDVPGNRTHRGDTGVRVIDSRASRRIEKPEIQARSLEPPIDRSARATDSYGALSRRESSPQRRRARPPRLDPPVQTASSRRKSVTRRLGLTRRG